MFFAHQHQHQHTGHTEHHTTPPSSPHTSDFLSSYPVNLSTPPPRLQRGPLTTPTTPAAHHSHSHYQTSSSSSSSSSSYDSDYEEEQEEGMMVDRGRGGVGGDNDDDDDDVGGGGGGDGSEVIRGTRLLFSAHPAGSLLHHRHSNTIATPTSPATTAAASTLTLLPPASPDSDFNSDRGEPRPALDTHRYSSPRSRMGAAAARDTDAETVANRLVRQTHPLSTAATTAAAAAASSYSLHTPRLLTGAQQHRKTVSTPMKKMTMMKMSPRVVHDGQVVRSVDDLVRVLNTAWQEQRQINTVNMKLNCVNLFANFATVYRMNRLRVQCDEFSREIESGKRTVSELRDTVDSQRHDIGRLEGEVTTLHTGLEHQQQALQEVNKKYYTSISEMQSTLSLHRRIIGKLEHARMKEDFALDALLALASLWVVNTRLVNLPLRLLYQLVSGKHVVGRDRRKPSGRLRLAGILIKFVLMVALTLRARRLAIQNGFHGSVGSLSGYLFSAVWYLSGRVVTGSFFRRHSSNKDSSIGTSSSGITAKVEGGQGDDDTLLLPQ